MEAYKDLSRVQNDAALGNSPLWFGEWGLPTQFAATDDFLDKWADAQKMAYSKGAGWIVSSLVAILHTHLLNGVVMSLRRLPPTPIRHGLTDVQVKSETYRGSQ